MPALTAALNSLPVESIDVLAIGALEADASRGAIANAAFCSCCSCCVPIVPIVHCSCCIQG